MIRMDECIDGHIYRVTSNNMAVGVFAGETFVGIQEKSGNLVTEHHFDTGLPLGTARPELDLGECPVWDLADRFRDEVDGHVVWTPNMALMAYLQPLERAERARLAAAFGA